MYKEHLTLLKRLQLVADLVLIAIAFVVAHTAWAWWWWHGRSAESISWLWLPPTAALVWLFFLDANGLYYSYRTVRGRDLAFGIAKSVAQGTVLLGTAIFLMKAEVGRLQLVFFASTSFVALLGGRLLVRTVLTRIRQRGWNFNSILVLGKTHGLPLRARIMGGQRALPVPGATLKFAWAPVDAHVLPPPAQPVINDDRRKKQ